MLHAKTGLFFSGGLGGAKHWGGGGRIFTGGSKMFSPAVDFGGECGECGE